MVSGRAIAIYIRTYAETLHIARANAIRPYSPTPLLPYSPTPLLPYSPTPLLPYSLGECHSPLHRHTLPQPVFRIPAAIPLRVNKAPCNNSPLL
ncbi:MAG: hypothetical protein SWX82_00995 [Cyanobacteriota bacterium]|nr:hypothetical protein [Cyanobacteriota bacterium]